MNSTETIRPSTQPLPDITISNLLHERAVGLMPPTTQVLAKGPTQYVDGVAPKYVVRGRGARLWDVDGNEFLDWSMGVGPVSLGYAHPEVDEAIRRQLADGITFSLMHPLEVQVSELLEEVIPSAQSVRFAKTGAEATAAAVRTARAYTGRDRILACGYHGWHDWYIGALPRHAGVPEAVRDLIATFPYNDAASLASSIDDSVAAVILEPMSFQHPQPGFLEAVVDIAHHHSALVIFDEIWTGFRWAIGGAQQLYGITPDLTTVSKGMGNGMPIAALVGRRDIMAVLETEAFFFSTFGGEALSLAATKATIEIMRRDSVPTHLAEIGSMLQRGYDECAARHGLSSVTRCVGHPARAMVEFLPEAGDPLLQKSLVQQELIRSGILWQGFHTVSAAHTARDVDDTLDAFDHALASLATALSHGDLEGRILGTPVQPVFRRTGDFDTKPRRTT
ncbi:MAG: aminotransferase class III-fold pyridoxal phosphate-dependent enzyme [Acidimicrobiia bacterium]